MAEVAILVAGGGAALDALVRAAERGVREASGRAFSQRAGEADAERVLSCDALLLAGPILLHGWPGTLKSFLDSWLARIPTGTLIGRTSRMRAGYVAIFAPDDPSALEALHAQTRGMLTYLGMKYCGRAAGYCPEGGLAPEPLLDAAARLGAALAGAEGSAGWPQGYREGARLFDEGQFYEAHEAWEEVWVEEEGPLRPFYQGLIQAAAALHHHGNGNWTGMASLLREAREKLLRFRPATMGLDVEAFLAALEPWRLLAEARCGRAAPVTRLPDALPLLHLS
jgi:hypothetical protein